MRAFIFSLDAFVAFTLALIAIYSLIFFSSVPSSYYYLLTQTHYLSRDVLLSISTTSCVSSEYDCSASGSILDNIVDDDNLYRESLIEETIGEMIPPQFGYRVEISEDLGESWGMLYDTADHPGSGHATESKKISVSSQVITFGYSAKVNKLVVSPYNYLSCSGRENYEEHSLAHGGDGEPGYADWGLIVCGVEQIGVDGDGNPILEERGNLHPSDILGGDIVPSADAKVLRLTVYI